MPPTRSPTRSPPRLPTSAKTKLYPGVALLDEHELRNSKGVVQLCVDEDFLSEVAAKNNARIAETGDYTPIVIGHTIDDAPEDQQPELVGWASNFRVEKFAKTKRKALVADLHVYADRAAEVERKYPRRSVELWYLKREIDPISLLGATTPERDLGPLLKFSRGGDSVYRYSLSGASVNDLQDAEAGETSAMKSLESKIDKLAAAFEKFISMVMGEADAAEGEDEDDLLGPDPEGDAEGEGEPDSDELPPEPSKDAAKFREPPPVKMSAGPGPSTNYLPSTEPKKMSRQDDEVVKLQRKSDAQAKELADLRLKFARTEAEKAVRNLRDSGIEFADEAEDISILAVLGTETREGKKHLERIKKNYRRSVVGQNEDALLDASVTGGAGKALTSAQARDLAEKHLRGEIKYEDAIRDHIK